MTSIDYFVCPSVRMYVDGLLLVCLLYTYKYMLSASDDQISTNMQYVSLDLVSAREGVCYRDVH